VAITLDATVGGVAANSYATVAFADDYFSTRLWTSTWEEAGEDDKARALMMATRLLDVWFDWYGSVASLTQALLWPRRGVIKPGIAEDLVGSVDNPWGEPFAVLLDSDEIPVRIKEATAELAGQLLVSDRTADSDTETQGIKSLKAGPISLEFSGDVTAKPIPDWVSALVSALGRPRSRTGVGAVHLYRA
jgi:hypothetical protein